MTHGAPVAPVPTVTSIQARSTPIRVEADLWRKYPLIDGSGSVRESLSEGPRRLALDARFGMRMRLGMPYRILNTVVEFDEGKQIAWRHFHGHRWQLRDLGDGRTEVTETFDWSTARFPRAIELLGFPARNRAGMQRSLDRLAYSLTAPGDPAGRRERLR